MLHRIALALVVVSSLLAVSRIARADLVCGDYLAGDYRPDEMTSTASQALADAADACICDTYCAPFCSVWDAENGAPQCMIGGGSYFSDPIASGGLGGDAAACALCMDLRCGAVVDACMADGS